MEDIDRPVGLLAENKSEAGQADMNEVFTAVVKHAPATRTRPHKRCDIPLIAQGRATTTCAAHGREHRTIGSAQGKGGRQAHD